MRILVTGGTGQIGAETVRLLRAADHDAVPASRGGGGGIALDLADASSVAAAAAGCDAALLNTPVGPDEAAIGLAARAALVSAGVSRIVMIGIMNLDAMASIPHFAAKRPIRAAVLDAGGTVLDCNFFQQNDRFVLPAILGAGLFPLPVGSTGVHPVDVRDIARAAARALTEDGWAGAHPLCGPARMTGDDYARNWTAALGRPIRYPGDDVAPFLAAMRRAIPGFGGWFEEDFRTMMEVTQRQGSPATPAETAAAAAMVGRSLRTHRDFAREVAAEQQEHAA